MAPAEPINFPVPDGTTIKQLQYIRAVFDKELTEEQRKKIHEENLALDLITAFVFPLIGWINLYYGWYLPITSWEYWLNGCVQGFMQFHAFQVFHDAVLHRQAYGKTFSWIVGIWICSPGIHFQNVNTQFWWRHLLHHKNTFERKDDQLFRVFPPFHTVMQRWITLNGFVRQYGRRRGWAEAESNVNVVDEFPGELGKMFSYRQGVEQKLMKLQRLFVLGLIIMYGWRPITALLGGFLWFAIVDTYRFIVEHGDQDTNNPFWQSTWLWPSVIWRYLFYGLGECHGIHHLFPNVPIYRLQLAADYCRPIVARHGVRVRTSPWALIKAYLIDGKPYGTDWGPFPSDLTLSELEKKKI